MTLHPLACAGIPTPLVSLPHVQRASLALAVRSGPRYEPADAGGVTHALEHLLFRGAGPYPDARSLLAACEALGEEPDAHTSDDALVVVFDVEPGSVGPAVELLLELLLRPRYANFAAELNLIREELLEQLDSRGRLSSGEDLLRTLVFGEHPLGRSILGSERQLDQLNEERVEAWRERSVQRANVVLAAAGPLTPTEWEAATRPLSAIPDGARLPEPEPPPQLGEATRFLELDSSPQVELFLGHRGPGFNDPAYAVLQVLHDLLDGGPNGALGRALVDGGLCYHAQAVLSGFPVCSLLEVELAVERRVLSHALEAILAAEAKVGREVDAEALAQVQRVAERRARWLRDDPTALAEDLAHRALRGRPLDPAAGLAARAAVTPAQVAELAGELFSAERRAALVLGNPSAAQRRAARRALARTW